MLVRSVVALLLLLAASVARADGAGQAPPAADYTREAKLLFRVIACAGDEALPANAPAAAVKSHCAELARRAERYRKGWLARARPFFEGIVPKGLPTTVVYPFGGGDLLAALVVFPQATEITAISLEAAGDPRSIHALTSEELGQGLEDARKLFVHLLAIGHSRTKDMSKASRERLPSQLIYGLGALAVLGYEPVGLRYFRLGPAGEIQYLTQADLDAAPNEKARSRLFESLELELAPKGGGEKKIFRHIKANLADDHLAADAPLLRHLAQKGKVSAMTKAASYLLWWDTFSRIRSYLLEHAEWMVSDSTGIPVEHAKKAGFEQVTYGKFEDPFFPGGKRATEDFRALWKTPQGPLQFAWGYPDKQGRRHLVITRRPAP